MLVEANTLIGRAGFKLVLGDVNFFPASKEDMTARGGPSNGGFTMRQAQLMGDRRYVADPSWANGKRSAAIRASRWFRPS